MVVPFFCLIIVPVKPITFKNMDKYQITLGGISDSITLELTMEDAKKCYHQGICDFDVAEVCKKEYVSEQMNNYSIGEILDVLDNYGCEYDDGDSKEELFSTIVWLGAGDILEEQGINY